jgi:hypothetical protein
MRRRRRRRRVGRPRRRCKKGDTATTDLNILFEINKINLYIEIAPIKITLPPYPSSTNTHYNPSPPLSPARLLGVREFETYWISLSH